MPRREGRASIAADENGGGPVAVEWGVEGFGGDVGARMAHLLHGLDDPRAVSIWAANEGVGGEHGVIEPVIATPAAGRHDIRTPPRALLSAGAGSRSGRGRLGGSAAERVCGVGAGCGGRGAAVAPDGGAAVAPDGGGGHGGPQPRSGGRGASLEPAPAGHGVGHVGERDGRPGAGEARWCGSSFSGAPSAGPRRARCASGSPSGGRGPRRVGWGIGRPRGLGRWMRPTTPWSVSQASFSADRSGAVGPGVARRAGPLDQPLAQAGPVVARRTGRDPAADDPVHPVDPDVRPVAEQGHRESDRLGPVSARLGLRALRGPARVDVARTRLGGLLGPDLGRRPSRLDPGLLGVGAPLRGRR